MSQKPEQPSVFILYKSEECGECEDELSPGESAVRKEAHWLCLSCADLDHLVFLPSGNTALTVRAQKHSGRSAVVVKFSKSRKRNERQGILVEEAALAKAEAECLGDEDARSLARERAGVRREKLDAAYVGAFADQIAKIYPGCPGPERIGIAKHACLKHSGRVGRCAAAKEFSEGAIHLAVRAHVRHCHTDYDTLLGEGYDRALARETIEPQIGAVLGQWGTNSG